MTNREKYLKDGVDIEQLDKELIDYICNQGTDNPYYTYVSDFFKEQAKPTLTEDERAILRNLAEDFKWIRKDEMGCLFVVQEINNFTTEKWDFGCFHCHLFQFIKERRRIRDS